MGLLAPSAPLTLAKQSGAGGRQQTPPAATNERYALCSVVFSSGRSRSRSLALTNLGRFAEQHAAQFQPSERRHSFLPARQPQPERRQERGLVRRSEVGKMT